LTAGAIVRAPRDATALVVPVGLRAVLERRAIVSGAWPVPRTARGRPAVRSPRRSGGSGRRGFRGQHGRRLNARLPGIEPFLRRAALGERRAEPCAGTTRAPGARPDPRRARIPPSECADPGVEHPRSRGRTPWIPPSKRQTPSSNGADPTLERQRSHPLAGRSPLDEPHPGSGPRSRPRGSAPGPGGSRPPGRGCLVFPPGGAHPDGR